MPYKPFKPSDPASDTSEGSFASPSPVSGHGRGMSGTLADLKAAADAAKARSREAMEAKLTKRRAKEQKQANLTSDKGYRAQKQAAQRLEGVWREQMSKVFPDIPQIAWFKREGNKVVARKEGKLVADLIEGYGGDEAVVSGLIEAFIQHWDTFGPMLTKQTNSIPTLGLLYACHATVAAESARLRKRTDAITEYEQWRKDNAHNAFASPPPALEVAYKAALAKGKGKA